MTRFDNKILILDLKCIFGLRNLSIRISIISFFCVAEFFYYRLPTAFSGSLDDLIIVSECCRPDNKSTAGRLVHRVMDIFLHLKNYFFSGGYQSGEPVPRRIQKSTFRNIE